MKLCVEIEKTFPVIRKQFSQENFEAFFACEDADLYDFHHTMGPWIENRLLKEQGIVYQLFKASGITERNAMSFFILRLYHLYIRGRENGL